MRLLRVCSSDIYSGMESTIRISAYPIYDPIAIDIYLLPTLVENQEYLDTGSWNHIIPPPKSSIKAITLSVPEWTNRREKNAKTSYHRTESAVLIASNVTTEYSTLRRVPRHQLEQSAIRFYRRNGYTVSHTESWHTVLQLSRDAPRRNKGCMSQLLQWCFDTTVRLFASFFQLDYLQTL